MEKNPTTAPDNAAVAAATEAQMQELLELRDRVKALETDARSSSISLPGGEIAPVLPLARPEFEHGGKRYKFALARFIYNDNIVTAEAAAADERLLAELLKNAPGIFTEITPLTTPNT